MSHLFDIATAIVADVRDCESNTRYNGGDNKKKGTIASRVVGNVEQAEHQQASKREDTVDHVKAGTKTQTVGNRANNEDL